MGEGWLVQQFCFLLVVFLNVSFFLGWGQGSAAPMVRSRAANSCCWVMYVLLKGTSAQRMLAK